MYFSEKLVLVLNILGIETSCDETAVAVVKDGRNVLSSVIASQVEEHKLYGGVVPEIASRRHSEAIVQITNKALNDAMLTLKDIDAIAVTYGPGLIGALLVGVNFSKGLSLSSSTPIVPTHHLRSHIAANYICHPELKPPFLSLIVSGGHSHIVLVEDYTQMKLIGKTKDDAAGEAFDKAARAMGLPYPGGVHMDKIAQDGNENVYAFPHPRVDGKYDFSFSGLKTAMLNTINNQKQKNEEINIPDLCASFRKAVVDCLEEKIIKAAINYNMKNLVVAGGVSANFLLRKRLQESADKNGINLFVPELKYCCDNAAMVASQGYYEFLNGNTANMNLNAYATLAIDKPEF